MPAISWQLTEEVGRRDVVIRANGERVEAVASGSRDPELLHLDEGADGGNRPCWGGRRADGCRRKNPDPERRAARLVWRARAALVAGARGQRRRGRADSIAAPAAMPRLDPRQRVVGELALLAAVGAAQRRPGALPEAADLVRQLALRAVVGEAARHRCNGPRHGLVVVIALEE